MFNELFQGISLKSIFQNRNDKSNITAKVMETLAVVLVKKHTPLVQYTELI